MHMKILIHEERKMHLHKTAKSTPLISEEIIEDYDEGFDAINSLSFRRRRSGKRTRVTMSCANGICYVRFHPLRP